MKLRYEPEPPAARRTRALLDAAAEVESWRRKDLYYNPGEMAAYGAARVRLGNLIYNHMLMLETGAFTPQWS